tara:strand:+ start:630 stop:974 length:345 start_codon:yes stop_codon:yes gene_type:complete
MGMTAAKFFNTEEPKEAKVYSTPTCAWCDRVVKLLEDHSIATTKIDITQDDNLKEMHIQCGGNQVNTVPQVVVDGKHIGGFTETERFIYSIFPREDYKERYPDNEGTDDSVHGI